MNAKELAQNDYSVFKSFGPENRMKQIQAVQYLQYLSIECGVPVDSVNVMECIGTGEGNAVVTEKNQINARFMTYTKARAEVLASLPKDKLEEIQEFFTRNQAVRNDETKRIRDRMSRLMDELTRYNEAVNSRLRDLGLERNKLELCGGAQKIDWAKQIAEVVSDGFFEFVRIDNAEKSIQFVTAPVILSYKSKKLAIDMRCELGQYLVKVFPQEAKLLVHSYKRNRMVCNTIHPFISSYVCWGDAASPVANAFKAGDYKTVFILLKQLMTTYDRQVSTPFVNLEDFLNPGFATWSEPFASFNGWSIAIDPSSKMTASKGRDQTEVIRNDPKLHASFCMCSLCQRAGLNGFHMSEEDRKKRAQAEEYECEDCGTSDPDEHDEDCVNF